MYKTLKNISFHIGLWTIAVLLFAVIFRINDNFTRLDIIYSIIFHLSILPILYICNNTFAKIYKKDNITFYTLTSITIILSYIIWQNQLINFIAIKCFPKYYFISQFDTIESITLLLLYLGIVAAIRMAVSWLALQEENKRITELQKENIESELQSLKSQINPHFLFNSLNVIYSLTQKNDKNTSNVVLKLSEILRYVMYDASQDLVTIESEVELIQQYIDIQQYRIEEASQVSFTHKIEHNSKIAPLLFLPLVENSYKHGIKGDIYNTFLNIKITSTAHYILFEIENNNNTSDKSSQKGGIGLNNINKRLNLLYKNQHTFKIKETEHSFKVTLEIRLNN